MRVCGVQGEACPPPPLPLTHSPCPHCRADTDGIGRLNCVQLMAMFKKLGREMSLDDANRLIRVINQNSATG